MAINILTKIFGSRNDRLLKPYRSGVTQINALEAQFELLTDDALRAKTQKSSKTAWQKVRHSTP